MSEERLVTLTLKKDEQSASTPALFSNFLQVSRAATEVQLEFIFVDVNEVAVTLQKAKESKGSQEYSVHGRTVAKLVVPALSFLQVKDHINEIFGAIERELGKLPGTKEVQHGSDRVVTG